LIPFSIVWETIALLTLIQGLQEHGTNDAAVPISALFSILGIYLLVGRLFVRRIIRRRTFYAITTTRVLVLRTFPGRELRSLRLADIPSVITAKRGKGLGTVYFGPTSWSSSLYGDTGLEVLGTVPAEAFPVFRDIRDYKQVEHLLASLAPKEEEEEEDPSLPN
jgi:hypothetical protein